MEQTRRQNPLSVELLVSTAKRYLARSEYRIQLDELVAQETERVRAAIDIPALAPDDAVDRDHFLARVRTYEGAVEALVRVVGVIGRWGDGSETPLVLDLILTPDLEFLYERFELLGSVAHLETTEHSDLEAAMADSRPNSWVWVPVGRYAWHTSNFERLLQEIGEEPFRRELLDAGFAQGSEAFLRLAVDNIKRIARRVR